MKHKIINQKKVNKLLIEIGDYITINLDINFQNTLIDNLEIDIDLLKKYLEEQFVNFLNLTRKYKLQVDDQASTSDDSGSSDEIGGSH